MLPERLKTLRQNNQMTQQQLADLIGVSQGTVGNWESGARRPDSGMLVALAELFGVSTDYLLGRAAWQHVPVLLQAEEPGEAQETHSLAEPVKQLRREADTTQPTRELVKAFLFQGDVPDEALEEVRRYAAYVEERHRHSR